MVKAKIEPQADIYCHPCSQIAGELTYHQPPACKAPADPAGEKQAAAAFQPGEIICPLTGEIISPDDPGYIDALIDCLERVTEVDSRLYAVKQAIRQALSDRTEGDAKTRRVAGQRRLVKLEYPSDKFEQSILKEAWQSYPQFRDEYLRIESIAPKLREVKKLENTAGNEALCVFRDMVLSANRGTAGSLPTVKIER